LDTDDNFFKKKVPEISEQFSNWVWVRKNYYAFTYLSSSFLLSTPFELFGFDIEKRKTKES